MAAWTIVAVPLLIMFFALGMERVEARLSQNGVGENDVAEFLEQARPSELRALFRDGISRALELFRLRRRSPHPSRHAITARASTPRSRHTPPRPVPRPHAASAAGSAAAAAPAAPAAAPGEAATTGDAVAEARSRAS